MKSWKKYLWMLLYAANSLSVYAQTDNSALSDYVGFYKKYLHEDNRGGHCAMYPSCSRYGLMVFEDCYFPRAMVYTADRMIRCGHDFDSYDLTLNEGKLLLLDLPPYIETPRELIYDEKSHYAYTDWEAEPDSTLLFINHLINKQMFREALMEIEKVQFHDGSLSIQLFINKLICYQGLGEMENAIYDYEVRFPTIIKSAPQVKFKMLDIFLAVDNFDMAQTLIEGISDTVCSVLPQKYAWQGIVSAYREKWDKADKYFHLLAMQSPDVLRDRENLRLIKEANEFKKKKGWLASSLSIIPGLGYIYTKRPKSALTAFVMNSLLGYAVYSSIKHENYGVAALLGVFNLSFYIGNISGSGRSALKYNQRTLQKIKSSLHQNNKLIKLKGSDYE